MQRRTIPGLVLCAVLAISPAVAEDVVMKAMGDEMQRSMKDLKLEGLSRPYFISYTVEDTLATRTSASFGSLMSSERDHQRWLSVEVRVGGYDLDNTNFFSMPSGPSGVLRSFFGRTPLTLEDDYREIRRRLWLATDAAYKDALEGLAKKQAALKTRTLSEELADFSREESAKIEDVVATEPIDQERAEGLVRELSEVFRELPDIQTSEVRFNASTSHMRYINSEGSSYRRIVPSVQLVSRGSTQAADGLPLEDFVSAYGRSMDDLPPAKDLVRAIRRMGRRLDELRDAALLERYNGPVLFEGQAAAELFAQAFAPGLLASRQPVVEDPRMAAFMSGAAGGSSLEDKVGARVLPRFMSLFDDPTLAEHEGSRPVVGYKVDDEGVPARRTTLVERGILKTLLAGRTPVAGIEKSTGNRRSRMVLPSNVVVTVDRPMTAEELREELRLLVQDREAEFGILVRRMGNPGLQDATARMMSMITIGRGGGEDEGVEGLIAAYKVYADGREELIRNVRISGISAASFKDIVAASAPGPLYSAPFSAPSSRNPFSFVTFGGGLTGTPPVVSWAVPSLLFEDMTLKRPSGQVPKPPVAAHPFFDDDKSE